ncbi:MAG: hypothetical protein IE916_09005 [Epsilonproteobacteria bacterium]|nr:hypothetical protein [Campylobacterota bacterium]
MTYQEWYDSHAVKHEAIVAKLLACEYSDAQIIDYFVFENMVQKESDFCLLYATNTKCHDIEYLNCYFCACPHFRFSDTGLATHENTTQFSRCEINAKEGKLAAYGDALHQDCSACHIPHTRQYIQKKFTYKWHDAMKRCRLS